MLQTPRCPLERVRTPPNREATPARREAPTSPLTTSPQMSDSDEEGAPVTPPDSAAAGHDEHGSRRAESGYTNVGVGGQASGMMQASCSQQLRQEGGTPQQAWVAQTFYHPAPPNPRLTDYVPLPPTPQLQTPYELGLNQLSNISVADLSIGDLVKTAAQAAHRAIQGNMVNMRVAIGAPSDRTHALITTRKAVELRICVAHVGPHEIIKCGAATAGLCRLPATAVQFVGIRENAAVTEVLPRNINFRSFGGEEIPHEFTAEYKLSFKLDWSLLEVLPQYRNATTFQEFHVLATAVEACIKQDLQIRRLRCYGGRWGPRLDYDTYRNNRAGVVYGGFPHRGQEHLNTIIGFHPHLGLDYSSERSEAAYDSLPRLFKI